MHIVIIGSGTMGTGIAEVGLMAGHHVILTDPEVEVRQRALVRIQKNLERHLDKGRLSGDVAHYLRELELHVEGPSTDIHWVIEAVPENLALKQTLFRRLDRRYDASVWLSSNTSSIGISRLQTMAKAHPERIGGLHFFNPVPRMSLVEIIRGFDTHPDYIEAAITLVEGLGKTGIVVPDRPGFLVNRVARPYYLEALRLVDESVAPLELVDHVMEGAGFATDPFRVMDLVGVDVNLSVTQSVYQQTANDERYRPHPWQELLVEHGYFGQKQARGFYRYE